MTGELPPTRIRDAGFAVGKTDDGPTLEWFFTTRAGQGYGYRLQLGHSEDEYLPDRPMLDVLNELFWQALVAAQEVTENTLPLACSRLKNTALAIVENQQYVDVPLVVKMLSRALEAE